MFKALLLPCLAAVSFAPQSGARSAGSGRLPNSTAILGLPPHGMGGQDLAGLNGPTSLVPGETLRWTCEFDWFGTVDG